MRLVSWNVNGLRACIQKGFLDFFHEIDADIFCIQESKLQEGQIDLPLPGYFSYWNYAEKKGYSGTAIFTRKEPLNVTYGIGIEEHDKEGRVITLEYPDFYMVTCYTPNSQNELARLPYRMQWEDDFRAYLKRLDGSKPVILCGDLNVAHEEIDLKNPKTNRKNAGFSDEEREKLLRECDTIRDKAMVEFLYSTAVRVSELSRINREDVQFASRDLVVYGKGGKERRVYINEKTNLYLKEYLQGRTDTDPALFVSLKGGHERLSKSGIEDIIRRIGKRANVEKAHPHRFRRTALTNALNRGMPLQEAMILAGHSKPETTMRYCTVDQEAVQYHHKKYLSA